MRHAVVLTERPDHVSYRYRWEAYRAYFAAAGWELSARVLEQQWWRRLRQFEELRSAGVVVLARRLLPRWQLAVLRRCARRLVFDFDDAVFLRDSYSDKPHDSRRRSARFRAVVQAADLLIAGNEYLAEQIGSWGIRGPIPPVRIVPTVVDLPPSDLGGGNPWNRRALSSASFRPAVPRRMLPQRPSTSAAESVQLVWIGSASTVQAFDRASNLFEHLGRTLPGLSLRVISDRMPSFRNLPVIACPWSRETEWSDLTAGDIGVSWLPDDPWSRGKCGLKVLQYMAAGLPVVANPVGVQAQFVRESGGGFLAETAGQWRRAIVRLAERPELRRGMGAAGRRFVHEFYSTTAWAAAMVAALDGHVPQGCSFRPAEGTCGSRFLASDSELVPPVEVMG